MSNSKLFPKRILLLVSGSIAAFKAVALCSKLVQSGYNVEVAMSKSAQDFIGAASFEGLTRKRTHLQNFEWGSMMAHIDLERDADLILNYPASATSISHYASGNGQELLGAIFLAHEFKKPFWIAPAMNQGMMANPVTQKNLNELEKLGLRLLMGESGNLACGEVGAGRLMEPETVLELIENYFSKKREAKKILITAGGTTEPIDPVRFITNFSTGETGYRIAKHLQNLGCDVTLIQSVHSAFQAGIKNLVTYNTTLEFGAAFERVLRAEPFDTLVHSAAVADFRLEQVQTSKIQTEEGLTLKFKPNPKYIQNAREFSQNKKIKIISFKLTAGGGELKLSNYDSEYIFHNELSQVGSQKHQGTLYARNASGEYKEFKKVETKDELVKLISDRTLT
jgi:phosphopantothenoylcysteine decarboxylase/phosphopantothenate--cysteine ligase